MKDSVQTGCAEPQSYAPGSARSTRVIGKRECVEAGMPDLVTVAELIAARVYARKREDERRADLYFEAAVRKLLRAQREARTR